MQYLVILLLLLVSGEAIINTRAMVTGILDDWNYASRSLYSEPYPDLKNLVDQTKKENDTFYRLENLMVFRPMTALTMATVALACFLPYGTDILQHT